MTRFLYIRIFTVLALTFTVASCNVDELEPAQVGERGDAVSLVCAMRQPRLNLDTKSTVDYKGILESTTSIPGDQDIKVGLVRVDRTRTDYLKYSEDPVYGLSFKAGMKGLDTAEPEYDYSETPHYYFTTGEMEGNHTAGYRKIKNFYNAQFFRNNTDVVNYISWYPYGTVNGDADEAHKDDPFTITEDLDLKTDVIYSDIARESMSKEYKDSLIYHHALCQFRIYVYRMINMKEVHMEGKEVKLVDDNVWGKLLDVKVMNECNKMTIQLPHSGNPTTLIYDYENTGTYSLTEKLPHATINEGIYSYPEGYNGVFYVTDETLTGDEHPEIDGVILPTGLENRKHVATYLAVPPEKGLLQLDVKASAAESEKTITIANEFKAGYAYNVVLCFSDHGVINAEVSIEKWDNAVKIQTDVEAEMFYDLSRYGTANSYIVSSSNLGYSFNGLTKGCGNTLNGGTIVGMDDCSLPSDSYIDLLYCEPEGLLELKSNQLIDRSVLFYVPGYDESENPHPGIPDYRLKTKGNAIIAARKTKGGEILWSWHIWVTDRPRDIGNNNGYSIMDRNLGALEGPKIKSAIQAAKNELKGTAEDIKYCGFYYQWGRKDPMIPGVTKPVGGTATMAESVQNPDKFYGYTYPDQGYEWHTEESGVEKTALWGYRRNRDFVKTVYDPCPPGYRVPELKAWTQTTGTSFKSFQVPDEHDIFNINGIYTWYPAAGWIDADDQEQGETVSISHRTEAAGWPAEKVGTDNFVCTANVMDYTDEDYDIHYGVGHVFNASDVSGDGRPNSADACPVRCISTASETIVRNLSKAQTSNCYIVPEAGTYMFKADVKGNAVAKVTTSGGTFDVYDSSVSIDHGQINHVAVLWWQGDLSDQTGIASNSAGTKCPVKFVRAEGDVLPTNPARNDTDFKDEDIAVVDANGYVRFAIDEDRYCHGNAILAAFDRNNQILWSWHLWLTDTPKKVRLGPGTSDGRTYTYYCMDRNLGATYCPPDTEITAKDFGENADAKMHGTIGFYYQWGRKDPIQGPPGYNHGTGTASSIWFLRDVNNGYSWTRQENIRTHASVVSRDDHVLYPECFLYKSASAAMNFWNNTNWTGDRYGQYTAMWGYPAGTTGATYDPRMTKTINDPCPPGYYIPPHYFFAAARLGKSGQDGGLSQTWQNNQGQYGLFAVDGGGNTSDRFKIGEPMWFPFGGYRAYDSGAPGSTGGLTEVGMVGAYHSGLDMGKTNVRMFQLRATGGGQLHVGPGTGATVRCRAY